VILSRFPNLVYGPQHILAIAIPIVLEPLPVLITLLPGPYLLVLQLYSFFISTK